MKLKQMTDVRKSILKDSQIRKFEAYGFLKDLKFFEPYLIVFLVGKNINLFEIGILISIREIIINVFEIPSGIIADTYGRKNELCLCFIFYMVAFALFFFISGFVIACVAMVFYGLGEAFRSGTHKAMIYTYLDRMDWSFEKTFVYGRTRSWSLIGASLSSLVGIVLILIMPSAEYIFIFSIVPYLIDFVLVLSYPDYLDSDNKEKATLRQSLKSFTSGFRRHGMLASLIAEEGIAEAAYSYSKDMVQPFLQTVFIASQLVLISGLSSDENLKVALGLIYAVMNLLGSFFSKRAYWFKGKRTNLFCLTVIHIMLGMVFALLLLFQTNSIVICLLFLGIYILQNLRKPIFIDEIDDNIDKTERATVLSIASQIKSIFLAVLSPILGFVAQRFGLGMAMAALSVVLFLTTGLLVSKNRSSK
jgi:MFS family permease